MSQNTPPVTRFAPSPTGFLHIGGVRTAIFNWLYAKAKGGTFLLRIEDTDQERSTPEAVEALLDGLQWMGLESDRPVVYQAAQADRHRAVVQDLLAQGRAYPCYSTPEELTAMREKAMAEGLPRAYDGTWRDRDPADAPAGVKPVIRFKAIQDGMATIDDAVQGPVTRPNETMDDLVLLRADGTPTYNLSVVVDDHDMGITHVIRGDDHLNNAFRQTQIYEALGWPIPTFAHIPLIHGPDGKKLSKRHGDLGVEAYRDMGYSAAGMFSYLLKLGWAHGDEDVVTRARALEIFDLGGIGKSPARLDFDKLSAVNKTLQDTWAGPDLITAALAFKPMNISDEQRQRLHRAAPALQERSATLADVVAQFRFFMDEPPLALDEKAAKALDSYGKAVLNQLMDVFQALEPWTLEGIQAAIQGYAADRELKLGKVFQPLRAALTGTMAAPGVADVAYAFGKDKTLRHMQAVV